MYPWVDTTMERTRRSHWWWSLLPASLVLALSVAACGDDDDAPADGSPAPVATELNDEPAGNVDVQGTIVDPAIPASNLGNLGSGATPYDPSDDEG